MEYVGLLRVLWRRRALMAVGVLLALCLGLFGMYRVSVSPPGLQSRTIASGRALQRMLVDTPDSLVVDARAKGAESIGSTAELLGDLMSGDRAVATMARMAGVGPAEIGVVGPGTAVPGVPTPLAVQASEVARPHQPYVVSVGVEPGLPILSILAMAPNGRGAEGLARAASLTLAAVAREAPVAEGRLRIEKIGGVAVGSSTSGGRKKAAIAAATFLLFYCIGVIALDGLLRRRHSPAGWAAESGARA